MADEAMLKSGSCNGQIYNILEHSMYKVSPGHDIILSGTLGEQWVVSRESFAKTYHVLNTTGKLGTNWRKVATNPNNVVLFAERAKGVQQIRTSWGEVLTANDPKTPFHGDGDVIMASMLPNGQPNMNDMWVVNGLVFKNTYRPLDRSASWTPSKGCVIPFPIPHTVCSNSPKNGNYSYALYIGDHMISTVETHKEYVWARPTDYDEEGAMGWFEKSSGMVNKYNSGRVQHAISVPVEYYRNWGEGWLPTGEHVMFVIDAYNISRGENSGRLYGASYMLVKDTYTKTGLKRVAGCSTKISTPENPHEVPNGLAGALKAVFNTKSVSPVDPNALKSCIHCLESTIGEIIVQG